MKPKHLIATAVLVAGSLLGLKPAQATPVTVVWDFTPATSTLFGTTNTYTSTSSPALSPAESILASGFAGTTPEDLYGKNTGAGEQGLGLNNDPSGDHEVTPGSFIQLNLSQLSAPPLLSLSLSLQTGSTTSPDEWAVYGTNTPGTLAGATLIDTGVNDNLISSLPGSILGTYTYLDFTALSGNVLLAEIDDTFNVPSSVPEPAGLAIFAAGLGGLFFFRRRIRKGFDAAV